MTGPEQESEWLGIQFVLPGLSELDFARVLRDVMQDAAFARPLRVRATEPRPGADGQAGTDGQLTLAFVEADRERALAAMQRLKTILLRYGSQVDAVRVPGGE